MVGSSPSARNTQFGQYDSACGPELSLLEGPSSYGAHHRFVFDAVRRRQRFRELCKLDERNASNAHKLDINDISTFELRDIDELAQLPIGTHCVYSFCEGAPLHIQHMTPFIGGWHGWPPRCTRHASGSRAVDRLFSSLAGVGMPLETQERILKLSTECGDVCALAV